MTLTKDIAAKFAIAIVAVAMVLSAFAPVAKAQTTEDLQKMINDLLAQVAALQASTGQGATSVASGVCPYTWTRDLAMGATGADVMKLQQFLNADLDTRVSADGAGSVGMETQYYGPATAAAVSKMQVKYRADILSPNNLVNPTGYFGPSSLAKANSVCVAAPVVTPGDTTTTDDTTDDTTDSVTLRGEADITNFEIDDADDTTIEEGDEDAPIAVFTVEFSDGDASISRLDLRLDGAGNGEVDPWDVFESISLWVDGDKVAEADASSKSDYITTTGSEKGTIRLSGLDIVGMEDEEFEIIVAANVKGAVKNIGATDQWKVYAKAMRYFDAAGVATTENNSFDIDNTAYAKVDLDEAGAADEIRLRTSSSNPTETTFELKTDAQTGPETVLAFDIDTKDSKNDITLTTVVATVNVANSVGGYDALISKAELVIDGTTITKVVETGTTTIDGYATLTFDVDDRVVIDAGDRVKAELNLRFKSLTNPSNEGATVSATVAAADIEATGSDDVTSLINTIVGKIHTLRSEGISGQPKTKTAVVTTVDAASDYATYKVSVEVTAFNQDVLISNNPTTSMVFVLEDGAASSSVAGSRTVNLTSTADETVNPGYFTIFEGETKTVTLDVTYIPGVTNTASRLSLTSIKFDDVIGVPTQIWNANPVADYRTDIVTIVN